MGQNSRTSLTQAVAEELHAPIASIRMVMADTDLTHFDNGTVGSQTTPPNVAGDPPGRRSRARNLDRLASQKWMVERASIQVADGKVTTGSRSAGFGELTLGQKLTRTIPATVALAPATEWKVAGTSVAKVNGPEIVTGAHKYTYDTRTPGMLHGKVLYPPSFGATLVSLDSAAAEAMPDVKVVHDVDFVGVTAPDSFTAEKAVTSLKAEWKPAIAETSAKDVYSYFKKNSRDATPDGAGLTAYTVAYIAHVPLEPRSPLAHGRTIR